MGKKKQRQETTINYGHVNHQGTADEAAYRQSLQNVDFSSPIVSAFGQAEKDVNDTVFEDQLPPGVAEKVRAGRLFDIRQRKGAALSDAAGREHAFRSGGLGNLAGMTQNKFVQTGGTNYGEQWGGIMHNFGMNLGSSLGQS